MSLLFDKDLIEINTSVIKKTTGAIQFDIYIRRAADAYTKLFSCNDVIDQARLSKYESSKGIYVLYIHKKDFSKYESHVESVAEKILIKSEGSTAFEMADLTEEMLNLVFIDIMLKKEVDEKILHQSAVGVKTCIKALEKDPKSMAHLLKIIYKKYPYNVKRAIATSVFAMLLAKKVNLVSDNSLVMVGLGGLLHDIGMTKLKVNPETKPELTPDEWAEVKEHPQLGKMMLDKVPTVTTAVKMIVLQHHEQPNGMGYPNKLHGADIFYPAKIVAIADCFTALNCIRPIRKAFTSERAFEILYEDVGKFDRALLDAFAELFMQNKISDTEY